MSADEPIPMIPDLATAIRTLTVAGFALEGAERKPGYALILMSRPDEFGAQHRYCFALSERDAFGDAEVKGARIAAGQHNAIVILVGKADDANPSIPWDRFLGLLGGPVLSTSALDSDFCEHLRLLGFNRLPKDLKGTADDLLEAYVRVALEFALGVRVVRYGQNRLFEARPDGIVLPYQDFSALYDAKAYSDGYEVTATSIRQFRSYVEEFKQRYNAFLPRLHAFIVISGRFPHDKATLENRSRDLLAECGVPLAFLTCDVLVEILNQLCQTPRTRRAINWKRVFSDAIVDSARVAEEIEAINKDQVVPATP
ncbi:MAG: hypothetical protein ABSG86_18045 [Thermoguttaceae bacterium]|jgi:hypothetical protein